MQEADSEQARRDSDLEAAVLDTLTDSVLTGAHYSHFSHLMLVVLSQLPLKRVKGDVLAQAT